MEARVQRLALAGIVLIALAFVVVIVFHPLRHALPPTATPFVAVVQATAQPHRIGLRTKTSGCRVRGVLPDVACTPGAVLPVDAAAICRPGYASSVRNVLQSAKNAAYAEYGIASRQPGEYEVDHLIPLQLGGSNDLANLWPEAVNPKPGSKEKDRVESYLNVQVCGGTMTLQQAQQAIVTDWFTVYGRMPR